jgi:hypothetical protein
MKAMFLRCSNNGTIMVLGELSGGVYMALDTYDCEVREDGLFSLGVEGVEGEEGRGD